MTDTALNFQRARKPEERELRRAAILAAAAELFDAEGPQGAGLNAIAARAGFTKSNVYRYFESREDVLLSLFLDEFDGFVPALQEALTRIEANDTRGIAKASVDCFIARPRLCHLISILSSVLEQNVSEATVLSLKREMQRQTGRIAHALHTRLPDSVLADCAWAGSMIGTLVAGMWPAAHPGPVAEKILSMPEFQAFRPDISRDLERAAVALLNSIIRAP